MSDIVSRIRQVASLRGDVAPLAIQAADEIERLRARLERAEFVIKDTRASVIHLNRQVSTFGIAATILERIDAFLADRESGVDFLFRWMKAKNPQLGGVSPLELLDAGRGHKLAQFIRNAESESSGESDGNLHAYRHGRLHSADGAENRTPLRRARRIRD